MPWRKSALLCVSLLAGCAGGPVIPETVRVPVPVPCFSVADLPKPPNVRSDAEILLLPDYQSVIAVWRDRILMRDALAERDAVLLGCVK